MPDRNRFSAAGPALGYLAQVEWALLIALRRMDTEETLRLSLETADDITFEDEGGPSELWQAKHRVNRRAALGNASPDLWKTLHNWIETADETSACFLVTTASAPENSAAFLLGPSKTPADIVQAQNHLDSVARAAGNASSDAYYAKYLALSNDERRNLLSRVTVLTSAVPADEITKQLVSSVRKAAVPERRLPLVERLRGWWHDRTMTHLTRVANGRSDWIDIEEIEGKLLQIAQSLRDDNLPLDFGAIPEPSPSEVDGDDRIFVEQLKKIMLHHERIRQAVYDHNRAFLQRSRWQREHLLELGELETYDRLLVEEWRRVFLPLAEADGDASDEEKVSDAQNLYARMQDRSLPEIRRDVRSRYVPIGSLHILADRLQIGWHPDWLSLLRHRLEEVQTIDHAQGAA